MQRKLLFMVMFCCTVVGSVQAVTEDYIFIAAKINDVALAEQCIKKYGIGIFNRKDGSLYSTPLHEAAEKDAASVAEFFLKEGGVELLKLRTRYGSTPLHRAASFGQVRITELFLKRGGLELLKGEDVFDETPLFDAVRSNFVEIARLFIQNGANIQVKNNKDETPYDLARSDAMRELLRNTQSANDSLLAGVIEEDREKVVAALDGGAQINLQDEAGQTALHRAVCKNSPIIARGLLSRGADSRIYDKHGKLPIDYVWCTGKTRGKDGIPMSYELLSIFVQAAGDNNKGN